MDQQPQKIRLKLPEQDLQYLTIGSDQAKRLKVWVDELPLMNMGETSRQLYQFIQELNRLQLPFLQRFTLLEIVRPVILHVCRALGKHYLNQSLVLPDKARRVASLAQALQSHLASGYKLVAVQGVSRINDREGRRTVAASVHRAIAALTDSLVRSYQLYFPVARHLWLELHQLYLLAEMHNIANQEVADADFALIESSSIADAYARVLLLSTSKPNQLRQQEIALVYRATEVWSDLIDIKEAGEDPDLFVFDLQVDRPPTYRTHVSVAGDQCRYIDSRLLVGKLASIIAHNPLPDFEVPDGMAENLLAHLQQAWGALTERSFKRLGQTGPIDISLGLTALHGTLSNGMDFERMVRGRNLQVLAQGEEGNPFLSNKPASFASGSPRMSGEDDPWSRAYDGGGHNMGDDANIDDIEFAGITSALAKQQEAGAKTISSEHFTCQKINASPGGYCLEWVGAAPASLRTGEMLGVRELGQNEWAIGVVRWVKQLATQGAQFGVELLAPRALPCGVRVLRKTGDAGSFMRALLLPALNAIGQPATLLVPSVGFHGGAKIELVASGDNSKVILNRKVNGTASFGQYEYKNAMTGAASLDETPDVENKESGEDFDSIWSSL
ncbi:MAG: hypothetical protein P1U67_14280 [Alcanivoracaceae bacterium]|nr:hypothetical protein [Alcanivoracaceae bacterium]